ncbi:FIST signal transduction protein [Clostridium estertheticum]|uniref:FIST signal transduction protein n=1 Tax=Clostridium estertheticum TaxID=238834 RepID=UPI001C0E07B4|nr:FIST N-terminal domain-containing protein [Clostridium estertheticum]MBU3172463.1 FIST C-terminal domain-containing protein [Clostridium estertheticum]
MAGKIREMINQIIQERSKGNPAIREMTISKLILKGLNPNKFDSHSADDPEIVRKLLKIAKQLNVRKMEDNDMNIKSVFSTKSLEKEIVLDIKSQLNYCNAKILIFFASSNFDQDKLSNLLQEAFVDCIVVGCSTAGEIVSGELLKNSVVAMAINSNIISDAKVEVIEHMKENLSLEAAFTSFEKYFNESLYTMDATKFVGIVLIDGVSRKEEKIMDLIGNRTNVFFVGGSAGDDFKYFETHVCANGKAYADSAVLIMLKINDNAEFSIIKTQSFKALDYTFTANNVNEETREVIEFNNKPAILEYAEAVGAASIEDATKYFKTNPVGLLVGDNDMFIRSPQQIKGTSMLFYCNILKGMEVRLMQCTNIVEDTRNAVENKIKEFGRIDGLINFNCVERTLELERNDLEKQYGEIFSDIPTIGFSTYGEEFIGHINQTATMLVFKLKANI